MQPVNIMLTKGFARTSQSRLINIEGHLSSLDVACRHCNIYTELIKPMRKGIEYVIKRQEWIIKMMEQEAERQKVVGKQDKEDEKKDAMAEESHLD